MKIIEIGKNTSNTPVKINGETKKTFAKYLKAIQYLDKDANEKTTEALLYSSWLASFIESDDFKNTIAEYDKKKADEDKKKADDKNAKKKAAEDNAKKKREEQLKKLKQKQWELEHPEEAKAKKEAEKAAKKAKAEADTEE